MKKIPMVGMNRRKIFKMIYWFLGLGLLGVLCAVGFVFFANHAAEKAGEGRLFSEAADVPEMPVGLVLGCAQMHHGRENLYFKHRIEAAVSLWNAGRVKCFIVSGDNHADDYNEPQDMKDAMIAAGVPAEKIVCDYAGLRTLDSVVRAKEIFGVEEVVIISQKFHNERALYLARSIGLEVVGLNAEDVGGTSAKALARREKLARVRMWFDVNVLKTDPKFLGKKEELPL